MARCAIALTVLIGCAGAPGPEPPRGPTPAEQELLQAQLLRVDELFYVERAGALFAANEYEGCIEYLSDFALAAHPDSKQLLELRAVCLWADNRHSEAIEAADRAVVGEPARFQAQLLRGNYYYGRNADVSIEAFEAYLRFRPAQLAGGDALVLLKLGLSYLQADNGIRAAQVFERVAKRFAADPKWVLNANNGLCAAYTRNEEFQRAVEVCEKIVADPRNVDRTGSVWFNLAMARYKLGELDGALEAVDEFLDQRPDAPHALKLREQILEARGRP